MIQISYTDWKTQRINNKSVLALMGFGVGAMWMIPQINFAHRVTGFFVISVPLLLLAAAVPGSLGGGDIKLMAAGGFLLGSDNVFDAFVIATFVAGLYVTGLLIMKKADRKSEIALGPFLCIGIISMLLKI